VGIALLAFSLQLSAFNADIFSARGILLAKVVERVLKSNKATT
jgi:hypothetical protein